MRQKVGFVRLAIFCPNKYEKWTGISSCVAVGHFSACRVAFLLCRNVKNDFSAIFHLVFT